MFVILSTISIKYSRVIHTVALFSTSRWYAEFLVLSPIKYSWVNFIVVLFSRWKVSEQHWIPLLDWILHSGTDISVILSTSSVKCSSVIYTVILITLQKNSWLGRKRRRRELRCRRLSYIVVVLSFADMSAVVLYCSQSDGTHTARRVYLCIPTLWQGFCHTAGKFRYR